MAEDTRRVGELAIKDRGENIVTDYDDDYPTCRKTYATLCIFRDDLDPSAVSDLLGIEPTSTQIKGEKCSTRRGRRVTPTIGGWFLSTEAHVTSKDSRRHIDWLTDRLAGREDVLARMRAEECRTEITCYWSSTEGHGGPTLTPVTMRRLADSGLELWYDFY